MLNEARQSDHYRQRKAERSNITSVSLPAESYEGYSFKDVQPKLIEAIKERLAKLLRAFESRSDDFPGGNLRVLPILVPKLVNKGKQYPVGMSVTYTKGGEPVQGRGSAYVLIVRNNVLITLLLVPEESIQPGKLEAIAKDHIKREQPQLLDNPITVTKTKSAVFPIDIDTLIQGEEVGLSTATVGKEDVPYTVRTDYRKGADFEHNQYGKGKVVTTSAGVKGDPGASGVLDWVDVDFGKPYVKSGQLTTVRRIPNVYTKTYWLGKA